MIASDIKLSEICTQEPETQFPLFGTQRMLMSGLSAMGHLMKQLLALVGPEQMAGVLSRYGYQIGMASALEISSLYVFDSPQEWLKSAQVISNITGLADAEIDIHHFDQAGKSLRFTARCKASFEVAGWQSNETRTARHPICFITCGALSGFASAVFGNEVLVREMACQAQGQAVCRLEGRTADGWDMSDAQIKALWAQLQRHPFAKEIQSLKTRLKQAQEDLAAQTEKVHYLEANSLKAIVKGGLIYRSSAMEKLLVLADKVAPTRSTVLIQGESGTGKEMIARYLHDHSGRSQQPFRAVNCAALPSTLLESELFGHVKGAFTGADADHKGLILEAGEGTFFLDEVGELPLELQSKFLRVLQEKEIRPVGGLKSFPIKARIIAATNHDLKSLVDDKQFRQDLYYRLAVFPLNLSPLRERKEDILPLSRHFLEKLHQGHPGFSPAATRMMETYPWPGNVRELENCIEYAVILSGSDRILPEHFPQALSIQDPLVKMFADLPPFSELQRRYTVQVLQQTRGNKTQAAKILGVSVTTLWRRLKEMEIEPGGMD